jgi:hypothetical protein
MGSMKVQVAAADQRGRAATGVVALPALGVAAVVVVELVAVAPPADGLAAARSMHPCEAVAAPFSRELVAAKPRPDILRRPSARRKSASQVESGLGRALVESVVPAWVGRAESGQVVPAVLVDRA